MMVKSYIYSELDYSKPLDRENLNMDVYSCKFVFVDKVKELKNPNPKYLKIIDNDITMFSYMFLRLNGEPLSLYAYQDLILNDPHRFKYFRASNQIGKSLALDVDAVYSFVRDHGFGFNVSIVSKSLPQSLHQMRRIKSLLDTMKILDWKEDKGSSDSMSVITLDIKDPVSGGVLYTNHIICAPCTEGLLGYDLHKLYLDEFEFWDVDTKYFFDQVAEPRTYHTKGSIIIFSNPNGSDSYGADLENLTLPDGSKKFHTYVFNFLDKPGNTVDELDLAKVGKTRQVVESTLMAIRSISDRNFFSPDEIDRSYDKDLKQIDMVGKYSFWFLDVGSKNDRSVLAGGFVEVDDHNDKLSHIYIPVIHVYPIGYPISRVVGSYDDGQDSDGWHVEKSVKEYLDEWKVGGSIPVFGVDVTGNSGISPLFNSVGISPVDVTFSGPVKSGMYQRFKYFMEKGLLHRIKSKDFDYEASHLEMRKSKRGYLMVHHENEDDHDDVMDSVAGLIHLADCPDFVEPSFKVI